MLMATLLLPLNIKMCLPVRLDYLIRKECSYHLSLCVHFSRLTIPF